MKIIMDIVLQCNKPQSSGTLGVFRKEVESEVIPSMGVKIEDPVWHEPREIKELVINYVENYCYISFGLEYVAEKDYEMMFKKMYESHGWTSLGQKPTRQV